MESNTLNRRDAISCVPTFVLYSSENRYSRSVLSKHQDLRTHTKETGFLGRDSWLKRQFLVKKIGFCVSHKHFLRHPLIVCIFRK